MRISHPGFSGASASRSRAKRSRRPETLVDKLAERLRAKILAGELPPGMPLRQSKLAASFGVSLIPVREAPRQLAGGSL